MSEAKILETLIARFDQLDSRLDMKIDNFVNLNTEKMIKI